MRVPEAVVQAVSQKKGHATTRNEMRPVPSSIVEMTRIGLVHREAETSLSVFNAKLEQWTEAQEAGVRITITPLMASLMLEHNRSDEWHNRPMHNLAIERYIRLMRTGRWAYTGEPIIFSTKGELLNGQTRLTAMVRAGLTAKMLLVFGVDRSAFQYMDTGARRAAADTFAVEDIPNYKHAAAAIKLLYNYDGNESWGGESDGWNTRTENDQLLNFYRRHEDIQNSIKIGRMVTSEGNRLLVPSWVTFLHYVCARVDTNRADTFFQKLLVGIGIETRQDMAGVARRRLETLTHDHARSGGVSQSYRAALVAVAWNAESTHRLREKLVWRTKNLREPFPRIV